MNRLVALTILLSAIIVTSCSKTDLLTGSGNGKNQYQELWERNVTEVYQIDQSLVPPAYENLFYQITVVDGEVELVIDTNVYITTDISILPVYFSVEDLFEIIANVPNSKPYQFEVEYDPVFGYPTYLFYDSTVNRDYDFFYVTTKLVALDAEKPFSYDMRKAWEEYAITDYKFEQNWYCFCPPRSALLTVKDNQIESGIKLPDSTDLSIQELNGYSVVDGLYFKLDQSYGLNTYDEIRVEYDSILNYPKYILFDAEIGTTDDELEIITKIIE